MDQPATPALPCAQPTSSSEQARLDALARYGILDTPREPLFDEIAQVAADVCGAPIAVVNFVGDTRQWFKAEIGIGKRELPMDVSICRHALLQPGLFVVPDLAADARFEGNPLVHVAGGLRFYAGALLQTPDGEPIGTVCVLDTKPRPEGLAISQARVLATLARQVMSELELRRALADRDAEIARARESETLLRESETRLYLAQRAARAVGWEWDLKAQMIRWSDPEFIEELVGEDLGEVTSFERWMRHLHPDDAERHLAEGAAVVEAGYGRVAFRLLRGGEVRWLEATGQVTARDEAGNALAMTGITQDVTERKLADEAMRQREQQLSAFVDQSTAGFAQVDLSGRFSLVNDRYCEIVGRSREELLTLKMQEITHPDDLARNIPLFQAAVAEGTPYVLEKRYIRPDGSILWVNNSVSVIRSPSGEPYGVLAVTIDITERRRAEEALSASETRLRLALGAGQLGEWELDLRTDRSVRAPRHDQIFGYDEPLPDWGFEIFLSHVLPEDREHVESTFRAAAAQGTGWHFQCRIRRANDGQVRWIAAHGEPQIGPDGKVERIFGLVGDITEQREPHERLRRLLDQLFAFVGIMAPDGVLIEANRAPLEAAGISAEEVIGKPFWEAYWWSHDPAVQARLRDAVAEAASGRLVRYDVPVRMAGGVLVTIDFQLSPMRDSEGAITHLIPSGVVVEDRVRAQAELTSLNAELEQRVATAIAEREQAQEALRQSQKLEAMGQLTGGVAHDFNNLLSPIIGGLDLLQRRGVGDERTQRTIAGALASAERAKTLVQRLLAFARRQPLQPTSVDLRALVAGMADLVASTSGPRVMVAVNLPPELPPVRADPNQLEMAILNLSVNARDAMPDGGTLTILAAEEAHEAPGGRLKLKPGRYVRLSVSDTGVGMDEPTLARAIEPFFSTKGIGKGTGLGLSMVHGLAAQLGGALDLRSRAGLGTTIELYLPVAEDSVAERGPASEADISPGTGTALLVDDEDLVRASTADMLTDLGYAVVEAVSAEEALQLISRGTRVDLVVTDHLMPGMTGTDLARAIEERRPGLPVLIISGYAEAEGIAPHLPRLTKPFRQADLAAALAAAVGQ
jgi:PAS domain S-box-containing protein